MELQYILKNPIFGKTRKYRETAKKLLLQETNFKCAKCSKSANINSDDDLKYLSTSNNRTNLEIAHIYGLRNFKDVEHGMNKFHINSVMSINSYENLILLCSDCHKEYDNKPTYEKYIEMLDLKREISQHANTKDYVYNCLFFALDDIIDICSSVNYSATSNFDYEVEFFSVKLDINSIDEVNKNHYSHYLIFYGQSIDEFFNDIGSDVGVKLTTVFSDIYKSLKSQHANKNTILEYISRNQALDELSKNMNSKLFDALVSYMIWKCEVLDKNDIT